MFDINGGEALVLLVVAVIVIGPERLPAYAEQLARLVKQARAFVVSTRERIDTEMGGDLGDVDWEKLDPRRYDPRRIVRDALLDDDTQSTLDGALGPLSAAVTGRPSGAAQKAASRSGGPTAGVATGAFPRGSRPASGTPVPFDDEAT